MKSLNRDLLVLSKKASVDKKEIEREVENLNRILLQVESFENFCKVNEVIDLNNYKIIQHPLKMERIVKGKTLKPFQFINNKN